MSKVRCYNVMLDDGPTTVVRHSDYAALAKRVKKLEEGPYEDVWTMPAGRAVEKLEAENKRLRKALEKIRDLEPLCHLDVDANMERARMWAHAALFGSDQDTLLEASDE